jgi:RNA 2',3'-cyclic 3'-phosphodiesterase
MENKRLFVAIDLPEEVTAALDTLNPHLPGARWLRPEQIHLTVSFLGNVGPIAEETLREKLAAIRFTPFFMPVVRIGTFPPKGKPNVIWAGVGTGHPQLYHVYKRVQEAALGAGLQPDLRAWHPHITFARCRDVTGEAVRPFLKANADFDAGLVRVESFSLYSSIPGPIGSAYTRELEVRAAI